MSIEKENTTEKEEFTNKKGEETTDKAVAEEPAIEYEGGEKEEEISDLEKLQAELTEQKDKYLRLYSEFENFRRRTAKEKLELVKTANRDLMVELLPVVDDFERAALSYTKKTTAKSMKEGLDLIFQKMVKALEQKGLEKIVVKKGDDFNDEFHEAITQIPAPEEELKGKIVDVIESGYSLEEKVIRFAKVVTGA